MPRIQMRSVVMGEKSFRLTGTPAEAVQARAVYDKVRNYVATTPEGADIRAWLTRELIPERPKEEEHKEAGEGAGEEGAGAAEAEVDQDGDEVMEDAKKPIISSSSSRRTSSRASSSSSSPRKKGGAGGSAVAVAAGGASSSSGLSNSFTAAVSKAEPNEGEDELDEE
jgi:hypothetical protein